MVSWSVLEESRGGGRLSGGGVFSSCGIISAEPAIRTTHKALLHADEYDEG